MRRLFIAMLLLVSVACGVDTPDNKKFSTSTSLIEVGDIGGEFNIDYRLHEYVGAIMPAASTDAEWITSIDNTAKGKISFRVLPNYGTATREATITLRYINTDVEPQVVVRQAGLSADKLTIELKSVEYAECSVEVTPSDKSMPYIVMMAEKSYFINSGITNAEELVYADQMFFKSYVNDTTLEEFLLESGFVMHGTNSKRWQNLSPAKEYVIYAYGLYTSGDTYERITPVYHTIIPKRLPERSMQSFAVEFVAEGPEVAISVAPDVWDGYYVVQLVEDSEVGYIEEGMPFTAQHEEQVAEAFFYIADHLYYFEEMSAEEIMQQLGYKGEASFSKTLKANHRYMALIYAIASDDGDVPMVVSTPQVEYFTTGTVERSDMTFEVTFSNILPRSVDVKIVPSTDETYSAVMMYAQNLPEGDKQEQLEYVMQRYAPMEISGVYSEHIDQLPPATEFVIAVYGYYAGAATTDLFVYRFTTAADAEGENSIVRVNFSAYDVKEVAAIEPYYSSMAGYADYFLSMEVETLTPAPTLHYELYTKEQYDSYTHEDIRQSMLEYAYTSSPDWALCFYGTEYVLCGLAEDENGYVGPMYVSDPILFTKEQVSDAEVFVELYKEYVR